MKTYEVTFTSKEIKKILNTLSLYTHIWTGRYDYILWEMKWVRECNALNSCENKLKHLFLKLRKKILPEVESPNWSGCFGIFSNKIDFRAAMAYNMEQLFRNRIAWFENPEGGCTVRFDDPIWVEKDTFKRPEAKCFKKNYHSMITISVCKEQLVVIRSAINTYLNMYSGDMRKLFKHYTNNEEALKICDEISEILEEIPIELSVSEEYFEEMKSLKEKLNKIIKNEKPQNGFKKIMITSIVPENFEEGNCLDCPFSYTEIDEEGELFDYCILGKSYEECPIEFL